MCIRDRHGVVIGTGVAAGGGGEAEEEIWLVEGKEGRVDGQKRDDSGQPVPEALPSDQIFVLRIQLAPPSRAPPEAATAPSSSGVSDARSKTSVSVSPQPSPARLLPRYRIA